VRICDEWTKCWLAIERVELQVQVEAELLKLFSLVYGHHKPYESTLLVAGIIYFYLPNSYHIYVYLTALSFGAAIYE